MDLDDIAINVKDEAQICTPEIHYSMFWLPPSKIKVMIRLKLFLDI